MVLLEITATSCIFWLTIPNMVPVLDVDACELFNNWLPVIFRFAEPSESAATPTPLNNNQSVLVPVAG